MFFRKDVYSREAVKKFKTVTTDSYQALFIVHDAVLPSPLQRIARCGESAQW